MFLCLKSSRTPDLPCSATLTMHLDERCMNLLHCDFFFFLIPTTDHPQVTVRNRGQRDVAAG